MSSFRGVLWILIASIAGFGLASRAMASTYTFSARDTVESWNQIKDALDEGDILVLGRKKYEVVERLGGGSEGTAFLVKTPKGPPVVLKIPYEPSIKEGQILGALGSNGMTHAPHLIEQEKRGLYLIKEYIPGPTLDEFIDAGMNAQKRQQLAEWLVELVRDLRSKNYKVADLRASNVVIDAEHARAVWIDPFDVVRADPDEWDVHSVSLERAGYTTLQSVDGMPRSLLQHTSVERIASILDHQKNWPNAVLGPVSAVDGMLSPEWVTHLQLYASPESKWMWPAGQLPNLYVDRPDKEAQKRIRAMLRERVLMHTPGPGESVEVWRDGLRFALTHPLFNAWDAAGPALREVSAYKTATGILITSIPRTPELAQTRAELERMGARPGELGDKDLLAWQHYSGERTLARDTAYLMEGAADASLNELESAKQALELLAGGPAIDSAWATFETQPLGSFPSRAVARRLKERALADPAFASQLKTRLQSRSRTLAESVHSLSKNPTEMRRWINFSMLNFGSLSTPDSESLDRIASSHCCDNLLARYHRELGVSADFRPQWLNKIASSVEADAAALYYLTPEFNRWEPLNRRRPPTCIEKDLPQILLPLKL